MGGSEFFPKIKRQFGLPIILIGSTGFFPPAFSAGNDMFFRFSFVFGAVKVFQAVVGHYLTSRITNSYQIVFRKLSVFFVRFKSADLSLNSDLA